MEQDFHGNVQVNVTWFFAFFLGLLEWMVIILVWFERSLHSSQVGWQSCPWPLKLMTSQAVERTWIHMGGYMQLRGEWVKEVLIFLYYKGITCILSCIFKMNVISLQNGQISLEEYKEWASTHRFSHIFPKLLVQVSYHNNKKYCWL